MRPRLHHVTVVPDNTEELNKLYSQALGVETAPPMIEHLGHRDNRTDSAADGKWQQNVVPFDAAGGSTVISPSAQTIRQSAQTPQRSWNPLPDDGWQSRVGTISSFTDPAGNVIEIHTFWSS